MWMCARSLVLHLEANFPVKDVVGLVFDVPEDGSGAFGTVKVGAGSADDSHVAAVCDWSTSIIINVKESLIETIIMSTNSRSVLIRMQPAKNQ